MGRAAITATGFHAPEEVYPNRYFEQRLDTTDARSVESLRPPRVNCAYSSRGLLNFRPS